MHIIKYFSVPLLLASSLVLSSSLQAEVTTSGCGADFNSALNHFGGRYNAPTVANDRAFAALKEDGSIKAWGNPVNGGTTAPIESGFVKVFSNQQAFSAIKLDGSISAWGNTALGGSGAPTDSGYKTIVSSAKAFAALKDDGSISTWGDANSGGSNGPFDSGYVSIASSGSSFVALKADGSISAWGSQPNSPTDTGYVLIAANANAFAALKADGTISSWGNSNFGGTTAPTGSGFVSIVSSLNGFAALNVDGSISGWGTFGDQAPSGNNFESISTNNSAFAALTEDGSIVTWGHPSYGGNGGPSGNGFTSIIASTRSFVALKADGSLTTWGGSNQEGDNVPTGTGYSSVVASDHAFAALKADGSLVSWGGTGSENAPTDTGYISIISNYEAFSALKADGTITSWGHSLAGGVDAPAGAAFVSINDVNAETKKDCSVSIDLVAPVITLNGDSIINLSIDDDYTEQGATALDDRDGTVDIEITGVVDTATEGQYTITYTAKDTANNTATETRTINVLPVDTIVPVITLNGDATITLLRNGAIYEELGATANDARDGEVSVTSLGNVDVTLLGDYIITYRAVDAAGNEATLTRTVSVVDGTKPVITLNGEATISISQGETYTDAGATAVDDSDGAVEVTTSGSVDTDTVGEYTITYHASDAAGNEATAINRVITVVDATKPEITLNGDQTVTISIGQDYSDAGASAVDDQDGELTVNVTGEVDANKAGTYTLSYSATDLAGNEAVVVIRTVIVKDTLKPVISLKGQTTIQLTVGDEYTEAGATATDNVDGTMTVNVSSTVDTSSAGRYTVTYTATDKSGNTATKTRLVIVDLPEDTVKPVLTLNGDQITRLTMGDTYVEQGANAMDERDGELEVIQRGSVNTRIKGTYTLYYEATDEAGNTGTIIRKVIVSEAAQRPSSGGGSLGWFSLLVVGFISLRKRFFKF